MTDKKLQKLVMEELEFEPSIDSADVGVLAEDGVVTLTGHVPSYVQKLAAERAAWRVRGVRAVVQNIVVRYAGEPTSDEEIAKRAVELLKWDSTTPEGIRVTVNKGWLTLEGQVDWQFQRNAAESVLRKLRGVVGITDNITLKPAARAETVRQRIENALKRSAEVEARQIRITVNDGGAITLEGKVHDWSERVAVERAAWSSPGVNSVNDRLTIAG